MSSKITAFEGAEGYGAATVGGRGGSIVHVTNLNDSGVGSLRWALESLSGPRTVVFDIGGTISLKSQILIEHGNVTIAGQTAAGEGIVIEGARVRVKASDVMIRGVHFRPGDAPEGQGAGDRDGLMIGTTDFTIKNVIVDRNSFSWAIDENVDINGRVQGLSFTNNIVGEALSRSIHPKGEHSKGLLVSNWDVKDSAANANITIAKNLFTDNMQRNPDIRAGQNIELINNFLHNYGLGHKGTTIGGANEGTLVTTVDVIGNVYTPGASTTSIKQPVWFDKMAAGSAITLVDNVITSKAVDAEGNQAQTTISRTDQTAPLHTVDYVRVGGSDVAILDSTAVRGYIFANVGAVNGSGRDAVDRRIVTEAATNTGIIIDRTSQVAHVSVSKALVAGATDTDRDGMTDWFEDLYGFDKRSADHNGDNDRDGFTNVEEYINGLITGFDLGMRKTRSVETATGSGVSIKASAMNSAASVSGFLAGTSEKIDVSAVIADLPAGRPLADYVEIAYAGGSSYVSVDADGAGAGTIKTLVAVVDGAKVTMADLTATSSTDTSVATVPPPPPTPPVVVAPPPGPAYAYVNGTAGNDTLTIRTAMQRIVEGANGGTDLAVTYVDYTLDANVENLSLKTGAIIGIGNALANKMTGSEADNVIEGLAGADKIYGMSGNDTLRGGDGDDWVEGHAGDDIIYGGAGADYLIGGAGCDSFCFTSGDSVATRAAAQDRIVDFTMQDRIYLDGTLIDFSQMATATIATSKYVDAYDAASRLMINGKDFVVVNGNRDSFVFWDEDNNGTIDGGFAMTNTAATKSSWMVAPQGDMMLV